MAILSLKFLLLVLVSLAAFHAWPNRAYRQAVLLTTSIVFVVSQASAPGELIPLALMLSAGFVAIRRLALTKKPHALSIVVAMFVIGFVILKRYDVVPAWLTWPKSYVTIGLSYILFRILHLAIDASQDAVGRPVTLRSFLNYTCGFLSFVSGPIQRYQDFAAQEDSLSDVRLNDHDVHTALSRIAHGIIKVAVFSALALYGHGIYAGRMENPSRILHVVGYLRAAFTYTAYLYFSFAGYMDIVIGIGRLYGLQVPENFDRPFKASNMTEFWRRWHITLSDWFRLYLFNPLLKSFAERWNRTPAAPYLAIPALFATFLVMGLWHGTTGVFFVYGIALGFGVSVNKLHQTLMRRRLGKSRYASLCANPVYAASARGLTCAYFTIAITCLWISGDELRRLVSALGPAYLFAALALASIASGLVLSGVDLLTTGLAGPRRFVQSRMATWRLLHEHAPAYSSVESVRHSLVRNAGLAVVIMIAIAAMLSAPGGPPEFVYMAF